MTNLIASPIRPFVSVVATSHLEDPYNFESFQREAIGAREDQFQGTDAERIVEFAGRTCYDSFGIGRTSEDYHDHLLSVGHGSVLEHATITFHIADVSRGLTHELVRHRAGVAISQRSTRYVDESESEWVLHPLMDLVDDDTIEDVAKYIEIGQSLYRRTVDQIQDKLVEAGAPKATARKQARGAARGLLGNALSTELTWTVNLRALRHFIEMRATRFADAEIRLLANVLYEKALEVCPAYFRDYGRCDCPDGIGYELYTGSGKV